MTVQEISESFLCDVKCQWFALTQLSEGNFFYETLKRAIEPDETRHLHLT